MLSKLKPCPFCGSEDVKEYLAKNGSYHISCTNTSCSAVCFAIGNNKEKAYVVWNKRGETKC